MRFFRIPSFTGIEAHRDDADRGSLRMVEGCLPHGPGGLRSGPVWSKIGDVQFISDNDQNKISAGDDGIGNSLIFISRNNEVHDLALETTEHTELETVSAQYEITFEDPSLYTADDANITPMGNKLYAVGDGSYESVFVGKGPDDTFEVFPDENLYSQEWSRFPKCQFFVQGPKKTIFAAGNPDKPLTVYISEPAGLTSPYRDTPYSTEDTTYNQGVLSTVDILGSNASKITALSTRGDQVVVHTDKGCHLLYAPAPDQANTGYRVEQAPATNFSAAVNSRVVSRASGTLTYWVGHDGQVYKDESASRGSEDLRSKTDEDQANWKSKGLWEHELPVDLTKSFAVYSPQAGMYWFFVESEEKKTFDVTFKNPAFAPFNLKAWVLAPQEGPINLQAEILKPLEGSINLQAKILKPLEGSINLQAEILKPLEGPISLQAEILKALEGPINLQAEILKPLEGPINLQAEILKPLEGPINLQAEILPPQEGPINLQAEILKPSEGPTNLNASIDSSSGSNEDPSTESKYISFQIAEFGEESLPFGGWQGDDLGFANPGGVVMVSEDTSGGEGLNYLEGNQIIEIGGRNGHVDSVYYPGILIKNDNGYFDENTVYTVSAQANSGWFFESWDVEHIALTPGNESRGEAEVISGSLTNPTNLTLKVTDATNHIVVKAQFTDSDPSINDPETRYTFVDCDCVGFTDGTGFYSTYEECMNFKELSTYDCLSGECIPVSDGSGQYATCEECQTSCSGDGSEESDGGGGSSEPCDNVHYDYDINCNQVDPDTGVLTECDCQP